MIYKNANNKLFIFGMIIHFWQVMSTKLRLVTFSREENIYLINIDIRIDK